MCQLFVVVGLIVVVVIVVVVSMSCHVSFSSCGHVLSLMGMAMRNSTATLPSCLPQRATTPSTQRPLQQVRD